MSVSWDRITSVDRYWWLPNDGVTLSQFASRDEHDHGIGKMIYTMANCQEYLTEINQLISRATNAAYIARQWLIFQKAELDASVSPTVIALLRESINPEVTSSAIATLMIHDMISYGATAHFGNFVIDHLRDLHPDEVADTMLPYFTYLGNNNRPQEFASLIQALHSPHIIMAILYLFKSRIPDDQALRNLVLQLKDSPQRQTTEARINIIRELNPAC